MSEYLFRWGAIHYASINRLFGVVYCGRRIVDGLVEEAFQVRFAGGLNRGLQVLVQNRYTTNIGQWERGENVKINIHKRHIHKEATQIVSNEFIEFCVRI